MNISDEYRCIFIHIPKAAGTSIKEAMSLQGQGHPPWQYFAENYSDKWKEYRKFTIVRNPWDRLVSAYSYAKMKESYWHNEKIGLHPDYEVLKDKSFSQCCQILKNERHLLSHESWHPQHLWVTELIKNKLVLSVDTVMHCETLNTDFETFCSEQKAGQIKLPHTNKSPHENYKKHYNTKNRKIAAQVYRTDIEFFKYIY